MIEGWIKILPEPTNDEQIQFFQNELNGNYQLELEKYIDFYEDGVGQRSSSSLTETSERILSVQELWIEPLRSKLNNSAFRQRTSGKTSLSMCELQLSSNDRRDGK